MQTKSLIGGAASIADLAGLFGASYAANQTAYDVADNGAVTTQNDVTTVSPPFWQRSLTALLNGGVAVADAFGALPSESTNKPNATTAAQRTASNTTAAAGAVKTGAGLVIGLIVAGIVAFFIFRK